MVDGITAFSIRDALDPAISQKLNLNFDILARAIKDDEVVAVSGKRPPEPRTDEMLWYKTDTGDLYLWAQGFDMGTGEPNGEWDWRKLDLNIVRSGEGQPIPSTASDGQLFYYDTEHKLLWIYTGMGYWAPGSPEDVYVQTHAPRWWTLQQYVQQVIEDEMLDPDGDLYDAFALAVLDIVS